MKCNQCNADLIYLRPLSERESRIISRCSTKNVDSRTQLKNISPKFFKPGEIFIYYSRLIEDLSESDLVYYTFMKKIEEEFNTDESKLKIINDHLYLHP